MFLNRLIGDVESKNEPPIVYNAINTFIEYLTLANSSGPGNYMKLEADEVKPGTNSDVESMEIMGEGKEETSEEENAPEGNVPLQRTIFINGNMLKNILKLDDKNTKEHALTRLEKLIEVYKSKACFCLSSLSNCSPTWWLK